MSVYGDNPRYKQGAIIQAPIWKLNGYNVTVHTDKPYGYPDYVEVCQRTPTPNGVFWRFDSLFEAHPKDLTLVRDADGRPTERELMALDEFVVSDKQFHIFQDHDAHLQWPIIACAFAFKGSLSDFLEPGVVRNSIITMDEFASYPFYYTNDQMWLKTWIWPFVQRHTLIHSHKEEGWFKETRKLLMNRYAFCGNGWDENNMPLYPPEMDEMASWEKVRPTLGEEVKYRYESASIIQP